MYTLRRMKTTYEGEVGAGDPIYVIQRHPRFRLFQQLSPRPRPSFRLSRPILDPRAHFVFSVSPATLHASAGPVFPDTFPWMSAPNHLSSTSTSTASRHPAKPPRPPWAARHPSVSSVERPTPVASVPVESSQWPGRR